MAVVLGVNKILYIPMRLLPRRYLRVSLDIVYTGDGSSVAEALQQSGCIASIGSAAAFPRMGLPSAWIHGCMHGCTHTMSQHGNLPPSNFTNLRTL